MDWQRQNGVMRCLEDHGIGFETGYARVPLVCQSCIYDLGYGSATVRPDSAMGYAACEKALAGGNPSCGSVGAGTGATVGKICGMERAMKSGLGMYAVELGELRMAAVVAVNALGISLIHPPEKRSPDFLRQMERLLVTVAKNSGRWGGERISLPAIQRSEQCSLTESSIKHR